MGLRKVFKKSNFRKASSSDREADRYENVVDKTVTAMNIDDKSVRSDECTTGGALSVSTLETHMFPKNKSMQFVLPKTLEIKKRSKYSAMKIDEIDEMDEYLENSDNEWDASVDADELRYTTTEEEIIEPSSSSSSWLSSCGCL
mmetsp:Transcript_32827/g.48593  ORF Transcript_32827/g.48593 Transcript_32827/m.48593 type:complete len:144 (-) Transcript_32827:309-740(-)|eukprot:CAMPEP_0194201694 /NCGR_PEP_ID=MMETSP0156-20130528/1908_1 /TAXON_ID=33649 /ORGANISM="Thalassionema nitzschioides, Strain L26-B" /LENGTH=143 /DNA_ID=CAMNT_0038926973 /DNA_START=35 /DNA_END=466 /DNA_ORIENTATION=-